MKTFLGRLYSSEEGATMVEYALMLALIGAALVTALSALTGNISAKFTSVSSTISGS